MQFIQLLLFVPILKSDYGLSYQKYGILIPRCVQSVRGGSVFCSRNFSTRRTMFSPKNGHDRARLMLGVLRTCRPEKNFPDDRVLCARSMLVGRHHVCELSSLYDRKLGSLNLVYLPEVMALNNPEYQPSSRLCTFNGVAETSRLSADLKSNSVAHAIPAHWT